MKTSKSPTSALDQDSLRQRVREELPEDLRDDFEAFTGCVAGATPVDELRNLLRAAGFSDPDIEIKSGSRDFINQWVPGKNAGDYVASASITARKPV